jgi:hypothetical protein
MVEKDRSFIINKTYLLQMLPLLYQTNLENQLDRSQLLFLSILINLLQTIKSVSIEKLATALPLPILFESRRRKIQRFLSLPILNVEKLWFPIITNWLNQNFPNNQRFYVVIRTNWCRINLIMISVIYDQRAIPVYFELLPKLGSSNFEEQKRILTKVFPLFTKYKAVVLGDREFCSVKLANWLRQQDVYFCLRLKKDEFIQIESLIWLELNDLGLKPGVSIFLEGVKVTKTQKIDGFNVACKWKRSPSGLSPKEGWFLLTNLNNLTSAIQAYKKRFDIEEMFRDFKSGGYNLEQTNACGDRLLSLILIISFAYSYATFQGQEIKKKGLQKYIGRVREYGRIHRRHSSFYVGLYAHTWVNFLDSCWALVEDLMKLNCNKLEYYLRGLRAMNIIVTAF